MGDFKYSKKGHEDQRSKTILIGPSDANSLPRSGCWCMKGFLWFLALLTLIGALGVANYMQISEILKLRRRVEALENVCAGVALEHSRDQRINQKRSVEDEMATYLTKKEVSRIIQNEINKVKRSYFGCSAKRALQPGQACCDVLARPAYYGNSTEVVSAYIGQDIILPCNATGYPRPTVTFNPSFDPTGNNRFSLTASGLQISGVKSSDSGMYTCTIQNIFGTQQKQIQLLVTDPVVATTSPTYINVVDGDTFQIRCDVRGSPPPVVTWQHRRPDGVSVPVISAGHTILNGNTVTVVNATSAYAGTYTCTAHNQYETDSASSTVSVTGVPVILSPPKTMTVMQGQTVTIYCTVASNPPSAVTWTYPLTGSKPPLNAHTNPDNSITLSAVDKYNNGAYRCEATNSYGTTYAQATLTVEKGVTVTASPHLVPVTGTEAVLNFQCAADGDPQPTTTWSKAGSPPLAGNSKFLALPGGNLIITGVDINTDTGTYNCYAENHNGNATDSVIVYKAIGPVNCTTTFSDVGCSLYQTCGVSCPNTCTINGRNVYGLSTYSSDSVICLAGAHAGVYPTPNNNPVIWKHVPYSGTFESYTQNGITSQAHGPDTEGNQIVRPSTRPPVAGNLLIG